MRKVYSKLTQWTRRTPGATALPRRSKCGPPYYEEEGLFNANRKRPHFWFYSSISRANSSPFFVEKRRLPAATTARCDCGQPRAARNAQSCQSLSFSLSLSPPPRALSLLPPQIMDSEACVP